ncbi:MAG: hypothetical protein Q7R39_08180 [Dehalococcoidia bacterium]|nr:hypothetical protein [Dehalococcoidia bacterium]
MLGCLKFLVVFVAFIGLLVLGGTFYLKAPEMSPILTSIPAVSLDEIRDSLPFAHPDYRLLPPLSPQAQAELGKVLASVGSPFQTTTQREDQATRQIQSAGLPVSGVYLVESVKGEPILCVSLDYDRLVEATAPGAALAQGVQSLAGIVEAKSLDFSGIGYITVVTRDKEGRVLQAITASGRDIESFRNGQITRQYLIRATAAQIQSRTAVLDLLTTVPPKSADVGAEVKDAYGININSPAQVALSAFGAGTMGNTQAADGLDVYRAIRRVEHEENADRLFADGKYAEARAGYQEALKWAPTGSDAQRNRAGQIIGQIATTYGAEAAEAADPARQMQLKRQEGRAWLQAAGATASASDRRSSLILAGFAMGAGGDRASACLRFEQAGTSTQDGYRPALAEGIKAYGCE